VAVKNQKGQTLVSLMVSVGLISIMALAASNVIGQLSQSMRRTNTVSKMVELDNDVANLMMLPQMCTCNFGAVNIGLPGERRGLTFSDPNTVFNLRELHFFSDPPISSSIAACSKYRPDNPVVKVDTVHAGTQHKVTDIRMGPFYPLGASGDYLTELTIAVEGPLRPSQHKLVVSTQPGRALGEREIQFCGLSSGQAPTQVPVNYSGKLFRFTHYSLNFHCPDAPDPDGAGPLLAPPNYHPAQNEPFVMTRHQFFWPQEEGDMITEHNRGPAAGSVVPPTSFATFAGTTVCFEESSYGDQVQLVVPNHMAAFCAGLKQEFLNTELEVVDAGFSLTDHCRSRFYR